MPSGEIRKPESAFDETLTLEGEARDVFLRDYSENNPEAGADLAKLLANDDAARTTGRR